MPAKAGVQCFAKEWLPLSRGQAAYGNLDRREQCLLDEPTDPDARREKQSEGKFRGCIELPATCIVTHAECRDGCERCDLDSDWHGHPVEPRAGNARELDVAQAD